MVINKKLDSIINKIISLTPIKIYQKILKLGKLNKIDLAYTLLSYVYFEKKIDNFFDTIDLLIENQATMIKKVINIIDKYNRENLPKNMKSKKNVLICHSKFHEVPFNNTTKNPSNNINDYVTIDNSGFGPKDFAITYSKKDVQKFLPQKHFTYAALIYCPRGIYSNHVEILINNIMKDGAIIEFVGFEPNPKEIQLLNLKRINKNIFIKKPNKKTKKNIISSLFGSGSKNKKLKNKKLKKQKGGNNICTPSISTSAGSSTPYNYSCFTLLDLKNMAKQVNTKYKANIKINNYKSSDKAKLMKDIHHALKCGNMSLDMCVLKKYDQDFTSAIKKNFKPKSPKGKNEWLSSVDIYDVMEQYMQKYNDFIFFGPVPIDWQNFSNALSRINLKKLKGKSKIGIVFNTDPSYKSGEHWISMFIDLNNKTICFFDSVADKPPKEVKTFMNKIIKQAKNIGIKLNPIINDKQHQFGNSECGIYSLYFIITRLKGKSCDFINNNIIKDKEMNKYRKKFFRPNF